MNKNLAIAVLVAFALADLAVGAVVATSYAYPPDPLTGGPNLGAAGASVRNQPFGPGPVRGAPVVGTELHFSLSSPATVLVIGNITFSIASGRGYTYPNLEIDGEDGG